MLRRALVVAVAAAVPLGAVATSAVAAGPGAGPAPSASPTPSVSVSPTPTGSPTPTLAPIVPPATADGHVEPDADPVLSPEVVAAQVAEAQRISGVIEGSTSELAVQTKRMDTLSARSNTVLEELASATDTENFAHEEADGARADLAALESRLAHARAVVKDWVFDVYSNGGGSSDLTGMLDALDARDDEVSDPLGDLSYLTGERTRALQEVRVLTAEQVRLTTTAEAAERTATDARTRIAAAKKELDGVMKAQREKIGALRALQMTEVDKAGPIASALVGARTPEAKAAAARLREALSNAVVETAQVGKPCSDDSGDHPNGQFPDSALCPLWSAPGERLSPAAAAAYNAMSQAYAAQTGTPLCVTDSYRSYPEQVAIKGTRGRFAATPGTSRHGLGRALDLCGGVDDFGSAAHRWMRQNAPLYGWFHPAWAEAGGDLPEPWHWEYAG
ncbi:M15 family metallopeptidase [Arthrobacter sp. NEB 688]|uniref:M15 family metallopeptidase n=1 Tax=Arthrobacter sp. NEB 688 TaxID=904039 RepID=UPI001564DD8C|nr:M15 family metallopeptidase [Arthrobacter sp. NEB 688]QKE84736.1 hypothetical protein HL663_12850 [Arthrobacter sp. NEB 688]